MGIFSIFSEIQSIHHTKEKCDKHQTRFTEDTQHPIIRHKIFLSHQPLFSYYCTRRWRNFKIDFFVHILFSYLFVSILLNIVSCSIDIFVTFLYYIFNIVSFNCFSNIISNKCILIQNQANCSCKSKSVVSQFILARARGIR